MTPVPRRSLTGGHIGLRRFSTHTLVKGHRCFTQKTTREDRQTTVDVLPKRHQAGGPVVRLLSCGYTHVRRRGVSSPWVQKEGRESRPTHTLTDAPRPDDKRPVGPTRRTAEPRSRTHTSRLRFQTLVVTSQYCLCLVSFPTLSQTPPIRSLRRPTTHQQL